ncbi:hypothetical protein [Deinococcus arcticus]|uniref:hypothetical protein n=1 Tax=Deinococcus arcticus TaxID=2136176 RepID=UPI0011B22E16|nr:hypothetical protein [Deinococcus arcticus]
MQKVLLILKIPIVKEGDTRSIPAYVKKEAPGKVWSINKTFSVDFKVDNETDIKLIMDSIVSDFDSLADMRGQGLPFAGTATLNFIKSSHASSGQFEQGFKIELRHTSLPANLIPDLNVNNSVVIENKTNNTMSLKTGNDHLLSGYITFALQRINKDTLRFVVHPTANFNGAINRLKFNDLGGSVLERRIWENLCTKIALRYGK